MIFKNIEILLLLPFVLGFVLFRKKKNKSASFRFPSNKILPHGSSWLYRLREFPFFLRLLVLSLFVIALAGPRSVLQESVHKSEGVDIVLTLDISGSMAAEDFVINGQRMNRLDVVKQVVRDFVQKRTSDRIGLVAFASFAYTVCPLTTDYSWLIANLERLRLGLIKDGTAIGSALMTSISRLKNSHAKSKIIILLTDGINNAGEVEPIEAARVAQSFGIKIYTIGAGTKGYAPFPAKDIFGRDVYTQELVKIDEKTLKEIASITQAKYFRATDTESLKKIYDEIDSMEKVEIEEIGYKQYEEWYDEFLLVALLLLLIELTLSRTLFLKIP